MKRPVVVICLPGILLVTLALAVQAAPPPPETAPPPGYVAVFEDDFEKGHLLNWSIWAGDWTAAEESSNGYLRAASGGEARLRTPRVFSAYRFRTDLRLWEGLLMLNYRQASDHGYRLEVSPGHLGLFRIDGDQWLTGAAHAFSVGQWHSVEISGTLGHLQVLVDGVTVLDYVDADPWYAGSIGVQVGGDPVHVDLDNVQMLVPQDDDPDWIQTNGPAGGLIQTIEIDPDRPDVLYAAGAGGGVFQTVDGGANWTMLQTLVEPASHIHDLLLAPGDPPVLYALAGRLYRSTDGGVTWQVLDRELWFSCVAMDRANPNRLLGGNWEGRVFLSGDGGDSWTEITANLPGDMIQDVAIGGADEYWAGTANGQDGRLYHTTNGGATWQPVEFGQRAETDIHTIFVDPDDAGLVYVGLVDVHNEGFDPANDPYLLVTGDGGATWNPLQLPGVDAMVNVIGRAPGDDKLYVGTGGTVFKSGNGGASWAWIGPPGRNGDMYDIAVDPRNGDRLYLPRRAFGIVKSQDGGATWTPANQGLRNVSISLLAAPHQPGSNTVYAATVSGEGTFRTDNRGDTWIPVNEGGITHPWADELAVSPHDPETVWEVADVAEVFETSNGGSTWEKIINPYGPGFRFGSIYALAPAPSDPDTIYALKSGFGLFKSTKGGWDWQFLHQSEIDYTYSLAIHPADPDVVYSGFNPKPFQDWAMVRQSTDGGLTWRTALSVPHASGVTSVVIDPGDPDTVYAGSTGQGGRVWVSRNAGDSWDNVNERFDFTNLHVLTADPADPAVAYAGLWGGGTFKTADGGATWTRPPNDPTPSAAAILAHPADPGVVYIADRNAPRIYRSADGGATWQTWFDAGPGYYRVLAAALAPGDPDVVYASIFTHGGPMAGDLFRIEGGAGTPVAGALPRLPVALATVPGDPDTAYAALHGYGVYKTGDGGGTWSEISGAGSGLPQTPEVGFNALLVDPGDPDRVYLVGGCDVDINLNHTGANPEVMHTVYRSEDGGASWSNLNDGQLGANSDAVKGLGIAPGNGDVLYAGTLKGVYRSTDGGATWTGLNAGLAYTHTAGIALSSDGARIYAPTLGGGVYAGDVNTTTHGVTWDTSSHLTATIYHLQVTVDPAESQTLYASAYPGGTFKSVDGGRTWAECNFGMASFEIDDPNRQGYYALAIAPPDPNRLYLGLYGMGVYRSSDGAGTWQPVNGAGGEMRGQTITALLVDPADENRVYVATEGGVYRTTDGGGHWTPFGQGLDGRDPRVLAWGAGGKLYAGSRGYELYEYNSAIAAWEQMNAFGNFGTLWPIWNNRPLYQYTTLLFDPVDPDIVYAGTFPSGIFKSTDGGTSWRERNVGWTNDGVFSLVFRPGSTDTIYAGTYNGVNRTLDGGDHWEMWDQGWPDEQWVFSIDIDPRDPDVIYACSKNGENEGTGREGFRGTVMKSLNGGATWFPITTGLNLNQEFYKILVDPEAPDTVYLATQQEGVFISRDGGALWLPWNVGLTNPVAGTNGNNVTNTMLLSAGGRYLYFGSAGAGVFRRQVREVEHLTMYLPLIRKDP